MQKLTADFDVVFPGEIYPRSLRAGDEVSGRVAEMAAACGKIETASASAVAPAKGRKAARKAPETQAAFAATETK